MAVVRDAVSRALAEDLGPLGDLSAALVPEQAVGTAELVCRRRGVLAGRSCAEEAFAQVDASLALTWRHDDGDSLEVGSVLAEVEGPLRSILTAERTALNFLCHLSGVATLTRAFVVAAGPATRVLDTRKTTPGLRSLEKAAVRAGGGANHRGSLSDGVMLKDNHLEALHLGTAVADALRHWPGRLVEVECETPAQLYEAAHAGATVVMCDNMTPDEVELCVHLLEGLVPRPLIEVSGGVSLENVAAYALAGADLVSVGAITHSAPALDIGLDLTRAELVS
jgi:nicotinate-nucleotide pyrophosphorylase (carboxylating)